MYKKMILSALQICCLSVFFVCLLVVPPVQGSSSLTELRKSYVEADKLLNRKRVGQWLKLSPKLENYPLYPYLRLKEIRVTQSQFTNSEISQIISGMEIPIPNQFKKWWLNRLIARNDWDLISLHYGNASNTKTQCIHTQALVKTKQYERAGPAIRKLWLVGHSQVEQCDKVFEFALKKGVIDDYLIWQRILLSKASGNQSMAQYLDGLLRSQDLRDWVTQIDLRGSHPQTTIERNLLKWSRSNYGQDVIHYQITRLAKRDLSNTAAFWQRLKRAYPETIVELPQVEKTLAKRLAWRLHQDAYEWLSELPEIYRDESILSLMMRSALAAENWDGVLSTIGLMSEQEANRSEWKFWRARALYETGDESNAKQLWSEIAPEHSYYGFLSADRLNLDYSIDGLVAQVALSEAAGIAIAVDGVQRIREWLALNKPYNARRELMQLKKTQSKEFWPHAAILFDAWKWHDGAIQAIYGSGQYARFELDVSHPSPFIETVRRESVRYGVPEHWIYAIMRQESHFVHDISSSAGAVGLMQLLPMTARQTASRQRLKRPSRGDLFIVSVNIRLGVAYFKQLLDSMNGNPVFALAGYNAGPRNSKRWQNSSRESDPAIWIETIPYTETRNYLKKILFNFVIYESIHSSSYVRLRHYLPVPETQQATSTK